MNLQAQTNHRWYLRASRCNDCLIAYDNEGKLACARVRAALALVDTFNGPGGAGWLSIDLCSDFTLRPKHR